jgi:hypothetical protein
MAPTKARANTLVRIVPLSVCEQPFARVPGHFTAMAGGFKQRISEVFSNAQLCAGQSIACGRGRVDVRNWRGRRPLP